MAMFIQHNGLVHTAAVPSELHTRVVYSPRDGALAKFSVYGSDMASKLPFFLFYTAMRHLSMGQSVKKYRFVALQ